VAEEGGALYNDGDMTVNGGSFTSNYAEFEGGGIDNDSTMTLTGNRLQQKPGRKRRRDLQQRRCDDHG